MKNNIKIKIVKILKKFLKREKKIWIKGTWIAESVWRRKLKWIIEKERMVEIIWKKKGNDMIFGSLKYNSNKVNHPFHYGLCPLWIKRDDLDYSKWAYSI